ncbi:MAG: B12-binding domain-containing radical SAM protein [Acidobacteriaceae bacterium]|nr:B12-binding domain-containing radical SAM protein [Acidobacteriaceae bacterium]
MLTDSPLPKILLFSPPYEGKVFGPPLGLLSLASSLRAAGFCPVIIDGATDPHYLDSIAREVTTCFAFGVSVLTGPMIREAISASRIVRQIRPDIPIIYGGWHPTLRTGETLRESFVDIVVRHQGEKTLTEVLQRQQAGASLDMVAGCWFKRDGRILSNQDRPASPLNTLPPPAYDLVDFEAYARMTGGRKLPYATSIGCPYACNYCTDMVFYNRRFNPLDVSGVVNHIVQLVKRHGLDEVALVDSNFLVDTRRALAIAKGFLDSGVRFRWTFQASTDLLCRLSDEEVCVLQASGVSHIGFGTESAAPEILRKMHKGHQRIDDMFEAARKCSQAGIRVTYNLIFGYPGEEEHHRKQTLRVMGKIAQQYDNVTFSPNLFTPYPGIPIWEELRAAGLHEPQSLEEWASVGLGQIELPWLNPEESRTLQRGMSYFLLSNELAKVSKRSRSKTVRAGSYVLRKPLHWSLKNHCFELPFELWLSMAQRWLTVRRSLLTGAALSRRMTEVH